MNPPIRIALLTGLLLALPIPPARALDPAQYEILDLTHAYNENTVYWPTAPTRFEKKKLAFGETDAGYFYSAYSVCTPEHGGTHLDAPIHFSREGRAVHELPLRQLIAPGIVIDVSKKAATNRDYRLSVKDVRTFEAEHGRIEAGTIVLMRTGWDRYWPDVQRYLGDDTPGDAGNLHFPGYGADAARLLVEEREVAMLGVDTASIDHGPSPDFIVHRIATARNAGGLENLMNLDHLPPTGFTVLALPMKIEGGSGGPVRVIALVPR